MKKKTNTIVILVMTMAVLLTGAILGVALCRNFSADAVEPAPAQAGVSASSAMEEGTTKPADAKSDDPSTEVDETPDAKVVEPDEIPDAEASESDEVPDAEAAPPVGTFVLPSSDSAEAVLRRDDMAYFAMLDYRDAIEISDEQVWRVRNTLPEGTPLAFAMMQVRLYDLDSGREVPGTKWNAHKHCDGLTHYRDENGRERYDWIEVYEVQPGDTLSEVIVACGWLPERENLYDYIQSVEDAGGQYPGLLFDGDVDELRAGQKIVWVGSASVTTNYVGLQPLPNGCIERLLRYKLGLPAVS